MASLNPINKSQPLIPGLPDEIAELCLLHLPYPYQSLARSVSSSWNKAITNPSFSHSRISLSLSLPYLFIFAFHRSTTLIQWQAFDPRSHRWFLLPPMPCPKSACPPSFSTASLPRHGKLVVIGGMRSDNEASTKTTVTYDTVSNRWKFSAPMLNPRSFCTAGSINDKIFVAGGTASDSDPNSVSAVERYDPDTDTWTAVAKMRTGLNKYDSAVVGEKMCVTEGWTWPFSFSPRGGVYDSVRDTWQEMSVGMREGWTGISVVVSDRLFVISDHGDCRLKVYGPDEDTWEYVGGDRFPCERVQKPYSVVGVEGRIYVVSCGLHLAVGRVFEVENKRLWAEWEFVEAPKAFHDLSPLSCHLLYA